jgi:hypothetical protein
MIKVCYMELRILSLFGYHPKKCYVNVNINVMLAVIFRKPIGWSPAGY